MKRRTASLGKRCLRGSHSSSLLRSLSEKVPEGRNVYRQSERCELKAHLWVTEHAISLLRSLKFCIHHLFYKHCGAARLLIAALSLLILFSSINTARAQGIAFDTASDAQTGNGLVPSLTFSHTVAGANRLLIVGVSIRNTASQTVGSVTYAGTAMTFVGAVSNGTNVRVEIWKLGAPATGANNVVVTIAAGATARFVAGAASFTGVNQTTPLGSFFSTTGNSATPSVNVTSVAPGELVIDTLALVTKTTTTSAGAGQTQRWNNASTSGGDANNARGAGSTEPGPSVVGIITMSWSLSAAQFWAIGAVALKPALPNVTLTKSVSPTGSQQPGTDLAYTVNFSNGGDAYASSFIITDAIPANTDFKVGSEAHALGTTGLTVAVAYSNNSGTTWAYTPASGGGGAPAGYDRSVTNIRWTFTGNLSQSSPNNSGNVSFIARIR